MDPPAENTTSQLTTLAMVDGLVRPHLPFFVAIPGLQNGTFFGQRHPPFRDKSTLLRKTYPFRANVPFLANVPFWANVPFRDKGALSGQMYHFGTKAPFRDKRALLRKMYLFWDKGTLSGQRYPFGTKISFRDKRTYTFETSGCKKEMQEFEDYNIERLEEGSIAGCWVRRKGITLLV